MRIPAEAWARLLAAGVTVRPLAAERVELSTADGHDGTAVLNVKRRSTALAPSHVRHAAPGQPVLVIAPSASAAALAAAANAGWSVIALNAHDSSGPTGFVRLPGRDVSIGPGTTRTDRAGGRHPGRPSWGKFSVVRRMLVAAPMTQVELARAVGVSQSQVSRALGPLRARHLVDQVTTPAGPRWRVADRTGLVDWWLTNYPGPGGITTYWFGLASVIEQAGAAVRHLQPAGQVAVSGDVAADLIAPWRRPLRAVVYAAATDDGAPFDLLMANLTPSGADEATLELVVPGDRSLFSPPVQPNSSVPLADTLQVAWDLRRAPGTDADQALQVLLTRLVAQNGTTGKAP